MIAEASAALKRQVGVLAYMMSWSRRRSRKRDFRVRITVDGGRRSSR